MNAYVFCNSGVWKIKSIIMFNFGYASIDFNDWHLSIDGEFVPFSECAIRSKKKKRSVEHGNEKNNGMYISLRFYE